jgi:hypothetical protein
MSGTESLSCWLLRAPSSSSTKEGFLFPLPEKDAFCCFKKLFLEDGGRRGAQQLRSRIARCIGGVSSCYWKFRSLTEVSRSSCSLLMWKKLQFFFSIRVFCCVSLRQFLSFSDYDRRSSSASKREGAYSGVRKRTLHEAWKHGMCSSLFSSQRSCKSPADSFKEQTYAVSLRLEKNLISDLSTFQDSHGCRM